LNEGSSGEPRVVGNTEFLHPETEAIPQSGLQDLEAHIRAEQLVELLLHFSAMLVCNKAERKKTRHCYDDEHGKQ
jgi:hypothetical protein